MSLQVCSYTRAARHVQRRTPAPSFHLFSSTATLSSIQLTQSTNKVTFLPSLMPPNVVWRYLFSVQVLRCVPRHDVHGSLGHEGLVQTVVVHLAGQVVKLCGFSGHIEVGNLYSHSLELVALRQLSAPRQNCVDQTAWPGMRSTRGERVRNVGSSLWQAPRKQRHLAGSSCAGVDSFLL